MSPCFQIMMRLGWPDSFISGLFLRFAGYGLHSEGCGRFRGPGSDCSSSDLGPALALLPPIMPPADRAGNNLACYGELVDMPLVRKRVLGDFGEKLADKGLRMAGLRYARASQFGIFPGILA